MRIAPGFRRPCNASGGVSLSVPSGARFGAQGSALRDASCDTANAAREMPVTTFSTILAICVMATMLMLAAFSIGSIVFPQRAYAWLNETADAFPAAQDLGSYGKPISGDELPDGVYKVGARTTSRMCILYTNPADAEARDSKEQAVVSVNGGNMTAVFYISKAYTYLYFGTMEQAAAKTNKKGTDASAYIAGDPDEGYVPHLFTIPISALNEPMTIATFSGGEKGIEGGKWYTREVVFTMSNAELKQIKADAKAEEEAQQAQEEEARKAEEEAKKVAEEAKKTEEEAVKKAEEEAKKTGEEEARKAQEEKDRKKAEETGQTQKSSSSSQPRLSENNVTTSDSRDEESEEQESQTEEPESPEATTRSAVSASELRGVRMNIVNPEIVIDVSDLEIKDVEGAKAADEPLLTMEQIIALCFLAALAVGVVIRYVIHRRSFDPQSGSREGPGDGS